MSGKPMLRKVVAELETSIMDGFFSSREVVRLFKGQQPCTAIGDYTDVFVVAGNLCIPWPEMSLISDNEMRDINRRAVDVVYDVLFGCLVSEVTEERKQDLAIFAKSIACHCFRNTSIEEYHGGQYGIATLEKAVVRHDGADIAGKDVARLNASEMARLQKEGSSNLREVLPHLRDPDFMRAFVFRLRDYVRGWDMPSGYFQRDGWGSRVRP